MVHHETCSHEGCSRRPWWPEDMDRNGHDQFCIFHSPLVDRKRKEFKEEWELFLAASFSDSQRVESLDCSGFIFPVIIDLIGLNIKGTADFTNARFLKDVSFEKTRFDYADYSGAIFSGDARFNRASFTRPVNFKNVEFYGKSTFVKTEFHRSLIFTSAIFSAPATFNKACFMATSFVHADFLEKADFNNARFLNEADFSNVRFFGTANFTNAQFNGKAIFDDAQFARFGYFSNINFSGTSISFGKLKPAPSTVTGTHTVPKPSPSIHYSLSKAWNAFQKWHLKYKSSTI